MTKKKPQVLTDVIPAPAGVVPLTDDRGLPVPQKVPKMPPVKPPKSPQDKGRK